MNCFWRKFFSHHSLILLLPLVLVTTSRDGIAAQLKFTWSDRSTSEDGFKIERKTNTTGTYGQIAQVGANSTTFLDSTVAVGTMYCYRVRAYNATGKSPYSNEACGTMPSAPYTLTVTKTGSGTVSSAPAGISCGSDCSHTYANSTYANSTPVTLTATPASGYRFNGWRGGCSGTGTCTLLINTNTNVTANFGTTAPATYTLTVTKVGSGTVTSSSGGITCGADCSQSYATGTSVSLKATPATGYTFSGWRNACTGTGVCSVTLNTAKNVTATFAATPTATRTGLVVAYSFSKGSATTVEDSSPLNNTGTFSGAAWTSSGKFGNALYFNGTNAWVTVGDTASLDLTTAMTLEAWVYPTALSGGTTNGFRTVILKEAGHTASYELYANQDTNNPGGYVTIGGTERGVDGPSQLPLNTWTHLAATYNGTHMRLFINSTQVAQRAQSGSALVSSGPLRIGGNRVWGEYFQGRIDEVRIYNRALTAAQIQADMNTPVTP